jgi:hypothetical protein
MAYKVKGVIENTVFDSAQDAALVNVLGYLPIRRTAGNNDVAVSVPDIMANGGEGIALREALNSALKVEIMQERITEADAAVVQNSRGHKTYLNVEIPYVTDNGEIKTVKSTIGIHITPIEKNNIYSVKNLNSYNYVSFLPNLPITPKLKQRISKIIPITIFIDDIFLHKSI